MYHRFLVLFALLVAPVGARTPPEFTAYLTAGDVTHVVLRDPATGRNSGWLATGDSYGDYRVGAFNAAKESLAVTQGESSFVLTLRSSQHRQAETDRLIAAEVERRLQETRAIIARLSLHYRVAHPDMIRQRQILAQLERQLAALRARG